MITSAPIVNSGEGPAFYWPQIGDPNPVPGAHPIFSGAKHVWRTWAFGAGKAGNVPQDTNPDIAGYEANCPEFVTSRRSGRLRRLPAARRPVLRRARQHGDDPVVHQPAGRPDRHGVRADRSRRRLHLVACPRQRRPRDAVGGDLGRPDLRDAQRRCVGSGDGDLAPDRQLDRRQLADAVPERDLRRPGRYRPRVGELSGYNANTPATPGHVFEVRENGTAAGSGIFTNLNVEAGTSAYPTPTNDGDLPVSDVVRDDSAASAVRVDRLRRAARRQRRHRRLARHCRDAALHGDASRDPAVVARAHVRGHGSEEVQVDALRGDALEGHLADGSPSRSERPR